MDRRLVELGPHCGKRGPYSFYKSFKYTDNGVWRTVATDQFFFVNISVSTPLCIGEMQLLWTVRNNVSDPLSSLRLYFLPEQLPDGRQHYHGENEVIATEKIVIRLSDLVTWLVSPTNESEWPVGLPWPLAQQPRTSSSTANSKAAADEALLSTSPVVVVSYPKYCRLMAALRRLESSPLAASMPSLLLGLGGDEPASKHAMVAAADGLPAAAALLLRSAAVAAALPRESSAFAAAAVGIVCGLPCTLSPNAKLVFCRSTCEHPEVEDHEFRCDYLAPNLKSRSRKRRVAATKQTESSESENDASPGADCASGSPRAAAAASAIADDTVSQETVTHASKSRPPRKSNGAVRTKGSSALPLARKREGATSAEQEEEDSFLKSVYSFMKERGTPIHRLPCLGFKQIDLYELYKGAEKLGGYNQICQKRRWKLLYDQIGGNPTNTSAATCTRKHYERLLLPFEQHLKGQPSGSDRLAILDRQSSSPSSSSSAGPPDAAEAIAPTDAEATVAEADDSRRSGAVICNDASAHQATSAAEAVDGPAESCEQPVTNWSPTNWRVGTAAAPSSAAPTGGSGPTSGSEQLPAVADRHGSSGARRRSPSSSDDRRVTVATDERKPRLPPPPALVPQHFGPPGVKLEIAPLPEAARHHHRNNIVDAQGTLMQDKLADGAATDKWSDSRSSRSPSRESIFRPATAASRSSAVVTSVSHVGPASQYLSSSASGGESDQRQFYRALPAAAVWPHSSVTAGSSAPLSMSVVGGPLPVSASAASSSSSRAAVTATTWRVPTNEAAAVACADAFSVAHPLPASSGRERGVPPGTSPAPGTVPQFRPLAVAGSSGARAPRNDSSGGGSGTSCRVATGAVPPPAHRYHSQQREARPGTTLPSASNSLPPRPVAVATSVAVAHLGSQSLVAALQPRLGTAFEAAACADVTATAQSKQQPAPAAHARPLAAVAALAQLVYGCVSEELVRLQRLRFPVVVCPYRYDCRTVYGDPGTAVVLVTTATNGACSAAAAGGTSKRKHDSAIAAASAVGSGSLQAPLLLHRGVGGTPVHDLTCKRPRLPGGSSSSCWTPDIRSGWSPNGIVSGIAGDSSGHGGVSMASQQHQQYHHRSLSAPQPNRKLLHSGPSTEAESQLAAAAGLLRPAAAATGHQPSAGRAAGRSAEACSSSLPPLPSPHSAAGEMAASATAAASYSRLPAPRAHATPSVLAVAPSLLLQQQQPWTVTDVSPSVAAARPAFAGADGRSGRRATAVVDGSAVIEERTAAALRAASAVDRLGRAAAAATAPFQDPYAVAVAAHSSSQQLRTSYELLAGTGQACGVPSAAAGRHLQQPSPLIHRRDPSPSGTTHSRPPSTAGRSLAATGTASLPTSMVSCREAADADGVGAGGRGSSGGSSSSGKGGEAMHSSSSTADFSLAGRQYL